LKSENPEEEKANEEVKNKQFPGIFMSTNIARFTRPVTNLEAGGTEWIGPLEQMELSIACLEEDIRSDTTH
jgi:DNA-directed RNA polymerase I subunit RPA2